MDAQRIVVAGPGASDVMRLETIRVDEPSRGEVLLEQSAVAVNFIDVYHRSGVYPLPVYPHGLGAEGVGKVLKVGEGVSELQVGQRVAYVTGAPGSYATHRNVAAAVCVPLPDSLSDVDAAAVMLKGLTVEYLIHRTYAVRPGQWVLWHAAAGGVGSIACQWLKALGARVIGTVGGEKKAEHARRLGCDEVIDYNREDIVQRVQQITNGKLLEVVYDSVGRRTLAHSLSCLARRGLLVSFGNASGTPEPLDLLRLSAGGSLYVTRPKLADYVVTREELLASAQRLFDVLQGGRVKPLPSATYPLNAAARAHSDLESRATTGSIVLRLTAG